MQLIPDNKKPAIDIHKRWLQLCILGIVFFSLGPVAYLIYMLQEDVGWAVTTQNVFSTFEVGRSWAFTLIFSLFFYVFISLFPVLEKKRYAAVSTVFVAALIFTISWAGHPASIEKVPGFLYHSLHFLAVGIWVGILLMVSWFSTDKRNWLHFLRWFTPVAMICFMVTAVSGFMMMTLIVDLADYTDSWMLNYGQALLIKHIIVVPILIFAFINGFLVKKKLQKDLSFDPKPWVKAESIVLIIIFSVTAFLGQQPPPHGIEIMLKSNGTAPLFDYVYGGIVEPTMHVQFEVTALSILLAILSAAFLVFMLISFVRKTSAVFTFTMSFFLIISLYLSLMLSIQ
ncbi:copper resistance D family protein [Domibacillus robiginosus]|uniref:copper resistance D family protein n=1 Tax=Domibacillus robiginosus TaxID=1071054 RepID=UPI00067C1918|nr:CopD family protein [Domibacillus robiginosus]